MKPTCLEGRARVTHGHGFVVDHVWCLSHLVSSSVRVASDGSRCCAMVAARFLEFDRPGQREGRTDTERRRPGPFRFVDYRMEVTAAPSRDAATTGPVAERTGPSAFVA